MLDFYRYIYKYFKISIVTSLLFFIYITIYIDGVVAHYNNIYISDNFLLNHQVKYTKALYRLSSDKLNNSQNQTVLNDKEDSKYNTIKYNFSIVIDSLGINEKLFSFPMTYNNKDYEFFNSKKLDKDLIDFELMEEINLKKGFMIGGHSSGLVYDKSELKNVFNGLETLKIGDRVKLVRSDGLVIEYVIKNTSIKELSEKITLSNKYYIYTCYPTGSNKKRLVVELDEIKSK